MEPCMCCASVTMAPIPARTPSVRKSCERRSTPAVDGRSPPSNRTGFRRDTTTTAHRPGSRQSDGSRRSRSHQDDLALAAPGLDPPVGRGRIRQVQDLVHHRAQRTTRHRSGQDTQHLPRWAHQHAMQGDVAVDRELEIARQLDDRTCPAALPDRRETARQHAVADKVGDHHLVGTWLRRWKLPYAHGLRATPAGPRQARAWRWILPLAGSGLSGQSDRTASTTKRSPLNTSKVTPIVFRASSTSAMTAATSSRRTSPRPPSSVDRRTRPVPGSSVSEPGRTIVYSRPLAIRYRSASAFASRYGRMPPDAASGRSAPIELTITYLRTPTARAASTSFTAPPRSTVRFRSGPLPGPAPAAKTTASAPSTYPARLASASRSPTTATAPRASRSAACPGLRIRPRAR